MRMNFSTPAMGCGIGLRSSHYQTILEEHPKVDWFEAVTENYMDTGGRPLSILEKVRAHYPVALHGVALSIGSADELNGHYLERLKSLVDRIDPFIVSDHLCWSSVEKEPLHDLLPLPFTAKSIKFIVEKVNQVQDFIGRPILLENISTYVTYNYSIVPEWEFLTEVAKRSGCGILLDINNIYVNSVNHKFDPKTYIDFIPSHLVGQIHLAGHTDMGDFLFDTHSGEIIDKVWDLYRFTIEKMGKISTLIEWDEKIPELSVLQAEAERAREIYRLGKEQKTENKVETTLKHYPENSKEPSLLEVQSWMKNRVRPWTDEVARDEKDPYLNLQANVPGRNRMTVYTGGYFARIHEALKEIYEMVFMVVGEETFSELAEAYAIKYHSKHYNLSFIGEHFPEQLRQEELSKTFPFLSDLAGFDRAISIAFHAFDKAPLKPQDFSQIQPDEWPNIQLFFQPSAAIFKAPFSFFELWKEKKNFSKEKIELISKSKPETLFISRRGLEIRCQKLDDMQEELLMQLMNETSLGIACENLSEKAGDEPLSIQNWFSGWLHDGLLVSYKILEKA